MRLGEKQELFARCLSRLLLHAEFLGHRVRMRELQRTPAQAMYNATHCRTCTELDTAHESNAQGHPFKALGIADSLHRDSLAIDLYLFGDDGRQLDLDTYGKLGIYWESLHELCRWGGRFQDSGHFSITDGGRR